MPVRLGIRAHKGTSTQYLAATGDDKVAQTAMRAAIGKSTVGLHAVRQEHDALGKSTSVESMGNPSRPQERACSES